MGSHEERLYEGPDVPASVLEHRARHDGERIAIEGPEGFVTYADLARRAGQVAALLDRMGVGPGDRVATMLEPTIDHVAVWFGISAVGAIEVPVNVAYRGSFLRHLLADSGTSAIFVDGRWTDRLGDLDLPELREVVRVGDGDGATRSLDEAWELAPRPPGPPEEDRVAAILYTSGTTGPAKGVVHTNASFLRNSRSAIEVAGVGPDDVAYSFFPLFHITGRSFVIAATFIAGGRVYLRRRFSVSAFWDDVRASGATWFPAMGAVIQLLLVEPEREDDRDNPVRLACVGAVSPDARARFSRRFGVDLLDVYGLTETGTVTSQRLGSARPGTIGRPLAHFDVEIHGEDGRPVAPGARGEIVVRPREPGVMFREYWGRPAETLEAFRGLWFHTGDAATYDDAGELVFLDRIKDAIRRRGENVSSFEVERTIAAHPQVRESAAYPVPSEWSEDEVMVAVVPRDAAAFDVPAFWEWCGRELPDFAVPRHLRLMDALPKTASERVEKYKLRAAGVTGDTITRPETAGRRHRGQQTNHAASVNQRREG